MTTKTRSFVKDVTIDEKKIRIEFNSKLQRFEIYHSGSSLISIRTDVETKELVTVLYPTKIGERVKIADDLGNVEYF